MTLPGDDPVNDLGDEPVNDPGDKPVNDPGDEPVTEPESSPAPPPSAPAVAAMPGVMATVGRGLDLNVAASAEIRRASLYVGLLSLLALGPIAAIGWALSVHEGGLEWLEQIAAGSVATTIPVSSTFELLSFVVLFLGFSCFVAVAVDAQLLAAILIGDRATGRRFDLRAGLALGRLRYWRLIRASLLIGLILLIPRFVINRVVMNGEPAGSETQALVSTALEILLSTPFAYVTAGVVLGAVDAREAVRRSWRLARARWRLALLIAVVNTAVSYIAGFALGAGGDILGRLGTAIGVGASMGPLQVVALAAIVAFAIVSIGSLVMTIDALTAGPQIIAFLGLTGYANGLDALKNPDNPLAPRRVEPLIARPMKIALLISGAAAILAVISLG